MMYALQIVEDTTSITLHTKEIYIEEVLFVPGGCEDGAEGKAIDASSMSFDLKLTTVKFGFPEKLVKGKGTLKLKFQCTINNQARQR